MDRRLVITSSYLVLALLVLTAAGPCSPGGAPASAGEAQLPQPAPGQMTERPQAASVIPTDGSVALRPLAPRGMSGQFAPRLLASAGASAGGAKGPSIYVPADSWRSRHCFRWGFQDRGIFTAGPATLSC